MRAVIRARNDFEKNGIQIPETCPLLGTEEKRVITKGVFSPEESLDSLDSQESLEHEQIRHRI